MMSLAITDDYMMMNNDYMTMNDDYTIRIQESNRSLTRSVEFFMIKEIQNLNISRKAFDLLGVDKEYILYL